MGSLTRVLAYVRGKVIQDEQNPGQRILLADPFETRTDLFLLLICQKLENALTRESVEPDRWFI